MKFIEWNINQRSNYGNKNYIPDYISEEINKENADVVILTEFYKTSRWEEFATRLQSYNVFTTDNSKNGQNDVLIAIKKKYTIKDIYDMESTDSNNNPNYLRVDIEYKGNIVSIIGTRICVDSYDYNNKIELENEMKSRSEQFKIFIDNIALLSNFVIGAGDFNNNRRNSENNTWSLNFMKDTLTNTKINLHTPYGASFNPLNKNEYALDHLFASNEITVKNICYSWSFMYKHEIYENGKNYKVDNPFPDHAILIANVEL